MENVSSNAALMRRIVHLEKDPEYSHFLEQLNVVLEDFIFVDNSKSYVKHTFDSLDYLQTHSSTLATVTGLSLRLKLLRFPPPLFKVDIVLYPGSHSSEAAINKQLNDKERVAAAFGDPSLVNLVEKCLVSADE